MVLLGDEGGRGLLERAGRFWPREEVHVDSTDAAGAELDVAGAEPVVGSGLLAARKRAISDAATTLAAPSANTPAFGTPIVATSPTA